jgi:hypothetical protein
LTDRFCWQRVVEIGRRKPCWRFCASWFLDLLYMVYGKLGMLFGFVVFLVLRSRFLIGFFGKLNSEFLGNVLSRRLEKMFWFVSFEI